jgi:Transposase, Mutator family
VTSVIGALLHERSDRRSALRHGHRLKSLSTTAGDLQLQIPKLRAGSFFRSLLERLIEAIRGRRVWLRPWDEVTRTVGTWLEGPVEVGWRATTFAAFFRSSRWRFG